MGFICCFVRVLSGTISLENYQLSSQEAKHMWNPLSAITLTGQMALGLLPYLPILIVFSQVKWYNNCYGKSKTLQVPEWRQWARDHGRPRRQPDPRQGALEWPAWSGLHGGQARHAAPLPRLPAWDSLLGIAALVFSLTTWLPARDLGCLRGPWYHGPLSTAAFYLKHYNNTNSGLER